MSETEKQNLKNLEIKLKKLVECILSKAASDPEFAQQLEEALSGNSLPRSVPSKVSKNKNPQKAFNAVSYLQEYGESLMREELESKTDTELKQILQAISSKKAKDLKNIERQQLIDEIVVNASRVLNQGSSFLQISDTVETPSNNSGAAD